MLTEATTTHKPRLLGFVKDIMHKIYINSGLDEYEFMDFNIQEIEEFEMKLYAPDYFYVYQKYTKLRNGKVLIPENDLHFIG